MKKTASTPRPRAGWGPGVAKQTRPGLPFVFVNAAMTADGKIAPASRHFEPFGSRHDHRLLYELRTHADAVLSGARTIDLNRFVLGNGGDTFTRMRLRRGLERHPVRVVVSGRATLDPGAEIFKHRFSPIVILVSGQAPERRLKKLRAVADEVAVFGADQVDFTGAFRWLRTKWGVGRLLCEGGGEVNGALFQAGLVDELFLTVCPVLFGGRDAPTLADGGAGSSLADACRLELKATRRVEGEMFLAFRVARPDTPSSTAARR